MRCEWCGITAHAACYRHLSIECNFSWLQSIMLPPFAVSIPRTDVPLETIIGVKSKKESQTRKFSKQNKNEIFKINFSNSARIIPDETPEFDRRGDKDSDEFPSPKDKDKDEGNYNDD